MRKGSMNLLTEAEWRIMKLLWRESPQTAKQIINALSDDIDWSPKTIKTLLNRLINKKVLGFKARGRIYEYHPLVKEKDCLKFERHSFLSRVYNGALQPMLIAFLEDHNLSSEEIDELRKILDTEKKSK